MIQTIVVREKASSSGGKRANIGHARGSLLTAAGGDLVESFAGIRHSSLAPTYNLQRIMQLANLARIALAHGLVNDWHPLPSQRRVSR